jgi:hypothetical protein
MAKTNFQYEKRQRELEKKKKAEEKARRKLEAKSNPRHEDEPGETREEVQVEGQETQGTA